MAQNKSSYKELARAPVNNSTTLVLSETEDGHILIGQQVRAFAEGGKEFSFFLKGAISVQKEHLMDVRDAINEVLEKI